MGRGATRRCWRRCAARSCRRSRRTARCAAGSRPEWPRRARPRAAGPASTVANWARSRTVRSWSACQRGGGVADRGAALSAGSLDPTRRAAVGVRLDVTFQTKPSIALELIGRALASGVPPGMVLADEVYGSTAEFRCGVADLGLDYALAVRSTTLVSPPCSGRRARLWRGQEDPLSVRALAARLPRSAWRWI